MRTIFGTYQQEKKNYWEFLKDKKKFRHAVTINQRCSKFKYKTLVVNIFYVFMTSYQGNMKKNQLVGTLFL